MSFEYAFETFGIPAIVLFSLGAIAYNLHKNYIFSIASYDLLHKYNPHHTLYEAWENGHMVADNNWHTGKGKYANKERDDGKPIWRVNIPEEQNGEVFIYTGISNKPEYNDKHRYFFRIKLKNIDVNTTEVLYQKKCFYGEINEYIMAKEKSISKQSIIGDNVHYWEPVSYIGDKEGDEEDERNITKEQLGINIRQLDNREVKNLIIEEVYIGKKCWKFNLLPCISDQFYLIAEPRRVET